MSSLTSFDAKWCPTYHSLFSVASKHGEDGMGNQDKIELQYIPYKSQYYASTNIPRSPPNPAAVSSNISPIATFPADSVPCRGFQRDPGHCFVVGRWRATDTNPLQCHEWLPQGLDGGFLIAAGFRNGRVSLLRFNFPQNTWLADTALTVGEVMQRNPRTCMGVAWNPVIRGQLGIALEKQRFMHTILVYQVETSAFSSMLGSSGSMMSKLGSSMHPHQKFGFETSSVTALCWLPDQAHILAAGTSACFLRLYDTRMTSQAFRSSSLQHKSAIVGISASHNQSHLIASWSKSKSDLVNIWDIRRLSSSADSATPVVSIAPHSELNAAREQPGGPSPGDVGEREGALVSVVWSPVEAESLATLSSTPSLMPGSSRSAIIRLWDIKRQLSGGRGRPEQKDILYVDYPRSGENGVLFSPSCLDWQKANVKPINNSTIEKLLPKIFQCRMLVGIAGMGVVEMSSGVPTVATFSPTNDVAWACGSQMHLSSKLPMQKRNLRTDISECMHTRAAKGYGLNVETNLISLESNLSQEVATLRRVWEWVAHMDLLSGTVLPMGDTVDIPKDPTAMVTGEGRALKISPFSRPADWGVVRLLKVAQGIEHEPRVHTHPILRREVYTSSGRHAAILACGWNGFLHPKVQSKPDGGANASIEELTGQVNMMMRECEDIGDFERSAAHAVFLGNIHVAVQALQRGIGFIEQSLLDASRVTKGNYASIPEIVAQPHGDEESCARPSLVRSVDLNARCTERSAEGKIVESPKNIQIPDLSLNNRKELEGTVCLLRLVSMCLSGYGLGGLRKDSSSTQSESQGSGLWRDACEDLLRRPEMSHPKHAHIRMACIFLLYPLEERTLEDTTLCLADRIAIASRYLPWESLLKFIDRWKNNCISEGNLEGMLLLGFGMEGMELLQAYLDKTGDVQTVALLGCRQEIGFGGGSLRETSTAPGSGAEGGAVTTSSVYVRAPRFKEWMSCYRSLLNHWQMWHARATLDIALSEHAAELKAVASSYSDASARLKNGKGQTKEENSVGGGTAHLPHLNVRCMFCNQNLPLSALRDQQNISSSWLSKQKPVLACCPACRKPLPRCYVCLSPLGCLNPYLERQKMQKAAAAGQRRGKEGSALEKSRAGKVKRNLDGLSCMPFDEWWSFCVQCKHGGHAHHILSWMSTHSACGVSGCNCKCSLLL